MGERANKLGVALLKHGLWLPFQIALVELLAIAGAVLTAWITGKALFLCIALVWIVIWFGYGSRSWAVLRSAFCAFAMGVFLALVAQYSDVSLIDVLIAGSIFFLAADSAFYSYSSDKTGEPCRVSAKRLRWMRILGRVVALVLLPIFVYGLWMWGVGDYGFELLSAAWPYGAALPATILVLGSIEFQRDKRRGRFIDPWVWLKYAYIVVLLGNAFLWAFTRVRY